LKIPVIGVIENMKMNKSNAIQEQTGKLGVEFLNEIPYESKMEEAIGNVNKLLNTKLSEKVKEIASKI
jgi:MinD superfamily P-loop ATPase